MTAMRSGFSLTIHRHTESGSLNHVSIPKPTMSDYDGVTPVASPVQWFVRESKMAANKKDATEPIRLQASRYPNVDEGTSCTQASFKSGGQAFLYVGPQGVRFKAMFKLDASRAEAEKLAQADPDRYQTGSTAWVTARFSADEPLPTKLWQKWLDESYQLSQQGAKPKGAKKKSAKKKVKELKAAKAKAERR